jgi:hypothetical protein
MTTENSATITERDTAAELEYFIFEFTMRPPAGVYLWGTTPMTWQHVIAH